MTSAETIATRRPIRPERPNERPRRSAIPIASLTLTTIMAIIFVAEVAYQHGGPLRPQTLAMFGGVIGSAPTIAIARSFFAAPLLHASVWHITGNAIALIVAGMILEPLVGRRWFVAAFCVSCVTGVIASLTFSPPNVVGVGASGGISGLFALMITIALQLPRPAKIRLIMASLRILVPAAFPTVFAVHGAHDGVHIDAAAHIGGMLGGAAFGFGLTRIYSGTQRPQMRGLATSMLAPYLGVALAAIGVTPLIAHQQQTRRDLAADIRKAPRVVRKRGMATSLPATMADLQWNAEQLLKEWPEDPRVQYAHGENLRKWNDALGAERAFEAVLKNPYATGMPGLRKYAASDLAVLYNNEGRSDEARMLVAPFCAGARPKFLAYVGNLCDDPGKAASNLDRSKKDASTAVRETPVEMAPPAARAKDQGSNPFDNLPDVPRIRRKTLAIRPNGEVIK